MTDTRVVLSAPTTNMIDGEYAYEVVPNVTYGKADGKPFADKGIFTFTLIKTAKGWRIASWAFAEQ